MDLAITSFSLRSGGPITSGRPTGAADAADPGKEAAARPEDAKPASAPQLSATDRQVIVALQNRDREVHAHESAHKAVGGALVGNADFAYQTGPDGRRYAVGGEVSIDSGAEREPRATILKMQRVVAAALAPAEPSAQDRSVAGQARATMNAAQLQVNQQQRESNPIAKAYRPSEDQAGGLLDATA